MKPELHKFLQLTKVDEASHTVTGVATSEAPDGDDEIADYDYCKSAFQKWGDETLARTKAAGQEPSMGNIRIMHGPEVGGKAVDLAYDDNAKQVFLTSKPVDDATWDKLKGGFYTAYSLGGSYAWRICETCKSELPKGNYCPHCKKQVLARYGADIIETSYVDRPCNPEAYFTHVKADGSTELCKFAAPAKPKQEGPVAEKPTKKKYQGVRRRRETAKAMADTLAERLAEKRGVQKDMYDVAQFAQILQSLSYLRMSAMYEAEYEGDESSLPEDLRSDLDDLAETFLRMATEEAAELTATPSGAGKSQKGETHMHEEFLLKARKGLAAHFKKMAGFHEKMSSAHSKVADSMGDEQKTAKAAIESMSAAHEKMAEHCQAMAEDQAKDPVKIEPVEAAKAAATPKPVETTTPKTPEPVNADGEVTTKKSAEVSDEDPLSGVQGLVNKAVMEAVTKGIANLSASQDMTSVVEQLLKSKLEGMLANKIAPDGVSLVNKGATLVPRGEEVNKSLSVVSDADEFGLGL